MFGREDGGERIAPLGETLAAVDEKACAPSAEEIGVSSLKCELRPMSVTNLSKQRQRRKICLSRIPSKNAKNTGA